MDAEKKILIQSLRKRITHVCSLSSLQNECHGPWYTVVILEEVKDEGPRIFQTRTTVFSNALKNNLDFSIIYLNLHSSPRIYFYMPSFPAISQCPKSQCGDWMKIRNKNRKNTMQSSIFVGGAIFHSYQDLFLAQCSEVASMMLRCLQCWELNLGLPQMLVCIWLQTFHTNPL